MYYPKNQTAKLDDALFRAPTAEYRGMPFWAWNGKLEPTELCRQIEELKEMGFGGFFMHPRAGLDTAYLSEEFMACVKACVDKAQAEGMLAGLYDEDRFPSGAAGGLVSRDPQYRAHRIRLTRVADGEIRPYDAEIPVDGGAVSAASQWQVLACFDIRRDEDGYLQSYTTAAQDAVPQGELWAAVYEECENRGRHNGYPYGDLLSKKTVERFVEVTHERYKATVGDRFGTVIPSVFTDEPQMQKKKNLLPVPDAGKDICLPWTGDFEATYRQTYGAEVLETLPELVWELPDGRPSVARYRYHDHICDRFCGAFCETIGRWCRENGIAMTGHHMSEGSLSAQTNYMGDIMRGYPEFGVPGIDMLCDKREYLTAKQCQSAVHQYGREAMMSELYGVTDWDYDFRGHVMQGNWQAALGVTVRIPHLSWYTMAGRAKRDYPASIHYQSSWYREYPVVEDHFARLNTALTRGKPVVRIAVVHPVESFWLCYGVRSQVADRWAEMADRLKTLMSWLLGSQLDFDFICEATLPRQCPVGGSPLRVGEMAYDAVIVSDLQTIRATTLERLLAFQRDGGQLLVLGGVPTCVDGVPSAAPKALESACVEFSKRLLAERLAPLRTVELRLGSGARATNYLYQMRQDGDSRWLFLCRGDETPDRSLLDTEKPTALRVSIPGLWQPTRYDTVTGEIAPLGAAVKNGCTELRFSLYACDSVLLRLDPGTPAPAAKAAKPVPGNTYRVTGPVPVTLTEPNALVLDLAEYRLDDEPDWQPVTDTLTIDNTLRPRLGWRCRANGDVQPWTLPDGPASHTLYLRYTFRSEVALTGTKLAVEEAASTRVTLNGVAAEAAVTGWYADRCVGTMDLPPIREGENELLLAVAYGPKTNIENAVLLGDFGVRLAGAERTLTAPVRELSFGDITTQGLPHYGGAVIYHLPVSDRAAALTVSHYRGIHVTVSAAGKRLGTTSFPPYWASFTLPAGCRTLDVTLYCHRGNTYGALHNWDATVAYKGPNLWRCRDEAWAPEYHVKPQGILTAPTVTEQDR